MRMVYGAVRQNRGYIHTGSEPGRGTTFSIYLPRYQGDAPQPRTEEEAAESLKQGKETILPVEVEQSILKLTKTMLEQGGYTVLATGSPGEAIRDVGNHAGEIHLLITDIVMPEMNGWDLAKILLSRHPRIKCLFTSGYTADVIADHGVLQEGVCFIQKPFTRRELIAKVRETLAGGQQ